MAISNDLLWSAQRVALSVAELMTFVANYCSHLLSVVLVKSMETGVDVIYAVLLRTTGALQKLS